MTHTVTTILEHEPLHVRLDEEEWTEYSRHETEAALRLAEWRQKRDALNQAERLPPVREHGAEGVVGFGCMAALALTAAVACFALWLVMGR